MKGIRIFERFGFNLPKPVDSKISNRNVVQDYDEWEFDRGSFDWINLANGERLADFIPMWQLVDLLDIT
ncbi:MAG TPA: hypothetical protein VM101_15525 [Flavitalea sp.]|nr:hypothetical protein [Flavitalea sp.]